MSHQPRVLIIVENLTVPLDRRVWQEATTLRDAGYEVSVICPKGPVQTANNGPCSMAKRGNMAKKGGGYTASYELLDGIHIFRHPLPIEADGALGYAIEYSWALAWEFALAIKVWFKVGIDVIQACNPPDTIFLLGGFFKYLLGKPFVFDHHDINPELFEAKFGKRGFFHKLLGVLERWTFKTATVSIATNETFKDIAVNRGGMDPDRVFIVRSVPDVSKFKRCEPDATLKNGRKHLIGYVGIMGAQDGVDILIRSMAELVHGRGRRDVQCAIVGSGTELNALKALARDLSLEDYITFTGFLSGRQLLVAFSTFDVGAIPDPKNCYNDKISMNKVFEYMAMGIPFVQFDLMEGRKIAGDAAQYARNNCPGDMAAKFASLLDDRDLHERHSREGQHRASTLLCWDAERARLLAAYNMALAPTPALTPARNTKRANAPEPV